MAAPLSRKFETTIKRVWTSQSSREKPKLRRQLNVAAVAFVAHVRVAWAILAHGTEYRAGFLGNSAFSSSLSHSWFTD